ncbi:ester cyclase [Ideonella oryzae]|uniref:Ester cyclase n=1 Tax=Ideonella oryzae TaxID=2937441 RepID=A0ABT1BH88_9BURK|nr:ester cyclase [Ideonella oryzae]MCO5975595.1 ester cyclase [Ideonella oryzae]
MTRLHTLAALLSLSMATLAASVNAAEPAAPADAWPGTQVGQAVPATPSVPPELVRNLANFDDLDFRVYTNQQWQDLHKTHSPDVIVHWPDGHTTQGIQKHIDDLKYMWTFAPDNRIREHSVRFGTADAQWTAVVGWLEGTFTQPMVLADGKVIPPTGKAYRIPMATIGHWNKDGIMFEEYLFWDNAEFMRQIGLSH